MAARLRRHRDLTVFQEFTELANKTNAINLGQGFPGWEPDEWVLRPSELALQPQQYTSPRGHPQLAEVLARKYSREFARRVEPEEVAVVSGATGGIYATMQALLDPGDEVVVLEPAYDCYTPAIELAGGVVKRVSMHKPFSWPLSEPTCVDEAFGIDAEAIRSALSPRTRAVMVTSPHSPTGLQLDETDIRALDDALRGREDVLVVVDEVYDQLCLDRDRPMLHVAADEELGSRTVTISSSGKTLSCTGWKVGWVVGPAWLVSAVATVQQWSQFCVPTPLQTLTAVALQRATELRLRDADPPEEWLRVRGLKLLEAAEQDMTYMDVVRDEYAHRRRVLVEGLAEAGLQPLLPTAGFFVLADASSLRGRAELAPFAAEPSPARATSKPGPTVPHDWSVARWLTHSAGVTCIPNSAFYSADTEAQGEHLLRFAYCKPASELVEAMQRLQVWRAGL